MSHERPHRWSISPAALLVLGAGVTIRKVAAEAGLSRAGVSQQLLGRYPLTPQVRDALASLVGEDTARQIEQHAAEGFAARHPIASETASTAGGPE